MCELRLILTVGLILSVCSESATEHKIVCQGSTMELRCFNSSFAITIQGAYYGRSSPGSIICLNRDHQDTMSDEVTCDKDVSGIVHERCDGKLNCSIPTDNETLSEPCPNVYKYLDVKYKCDYVSKRDSRQIYRITNLSRSQTAAVPTSSTATPKLKPSTGAIQPTPSLVYKFKKISTVHKIQIKIITRSTSWPTSPSRSSSHSVSVTSFSYAQRLTATAAITNLRSASLPAPSNPTSQTTENKTARTLTLAGHQGTMKLFHFILSFHIVREENIQKHTATSLAWFLFGILVGLLIVIAVLVFLRLRRFQQERKGKPNKSSYTKQRVSLDDGTMDENIELHPKELEAMEMESQFGETV